MTNPVSPSTTIDGLGRSRLLRPHITRSIFFTPHPHGASQRKKRPPEPAIEEDGLNTSEVFCCGLLYTSEQISSSAIPQPLDVLKNASAASTARLQLKAALSRAPFGDYRGLYTSPANLDQKPPVSERPSSETSTTSVGPSLPTHPSRSRSRENSIRNELPPQLLRLGDTSIETLNRSPSDHTRSLSPSSFRLRVGLARSPVAARTYSPEAASETGCPCSPNLPLSHQGYEARPSLLSTPTPSDEDYYMNHVVTSAPRVLDLLSGTEPLRLQCESPLSYGDNQAGISSDSRQRLATHDNDGGKRDAMFVSSRSKGIIDSKMSSFRYFDSRLPPAYTAPSHRHFERETPGPLDPNAPISNTSEITSPAIRAVDFISSSSAASEDHVSFSASRSVRARQTLIPPPPPGSATTCQAPVSSCVSLNSSFGITDDRSGTSEVSTMLKSRPAVRLKTTGSVRYRATLARFENHVPCHSIVKGVGGVKFMKGFVFSLRSVRNEDALSGSLSSATNCFGPVRKNCGPIAVTLTRRKRSKIYLLQDLQKVDGSSRNLRLLQAAGFGTPAAWEEIPVAELKNKAVVCYFRNHTVPLTLVFESREDALDLVELLALLLKKYRKEDYVTVDFYLDELSTNVS